MSIKRLIPCLAMLAALLPQSVTAQTVTNEIPVSFGEMVVGGASTVTIPSSSDSRSSTGAVALVGSALVQRGSMDISFTPGSQVVISMPASISMTGGNNPTFEPVLEGPAVQTIPAGGVLTIYIGGTVTFTSSGATGIASVTVPVTVDPF